MLLVIVDHLAAEGDKMIHVLARPKSVSTAEAVVASDRPAFVILKAPIRRKRAVPALGTRLSDLHVYPPRPEAILFSVDITVKPNVLEEIRLPDLRPDTRSCGTMNPLLRTKPSNPLH